MTQVPPGHWDVRVDRGYDHGYVGFEVVETVGIDQMSQLLFHRIPEHSMLHCLAAAAHSRVVEIKAITE